ncbi:MAG: hypothetical protein H6812_04610 [Phycisphaeraceae bacterium]|nr:hypothetical protein [Phycisphaeraceae bacterium]
MKNSNRTATRKQTEGPAQQPVAKVKIGLITAAIWANQTEKGTLYNATIDRRYRDGNGDWKSSGSYGRDDLLTLAKVADLAHSKIVELAAADRAEADEQPDAA